jgi:hypothetical protein
MARTRAVAMASEGSAADAATAALVKGNAVDAVIAGVFAAAATSPSVLLGPVQILLGGGGLGLRAVDGRVRQAGKGAPRPRGFTPEQGVAPAARVGVPTLPAALAAALASSGALTLAQVMAPAIAQAEGARKDLLRRIAQHGPSAVASEGIAGELIAVCGRVAGGLLTRDDLEAALPVIVAAREVTLHDSTRQAAFVPWQEAVVAGKRSEASLLGTHVHAIAAVDHRGVVAAACYERPDEGIPVESLGLVAPFTASPVLRGKPRVRPGAPVPAPAPLALIRSTTESALDMALAIACDPDAEQALAEALDAWSKDAYDAAPAYEGQGALIGVLRTNGAVSALARRGGLHTGVSRA